jgi:GNAT superfamily N-acetyltransferase
MTLDLNNANLIKPKLKCEQVSDWSEFESHILPLAEWYPKREKADAVEMLKEATSKRPDHTMHFVCRMDGSAVCSTTLLLHQETAGIYDVVTLPEYRGKGVGTELMNYVFRFALDRGAKLAVLQSYHKAAPWYESMGFQKTGRYSGMYYSTERMRSDREVRLGNSA